jgi:hypothetical protein
LPHPHAQPEHHLPVERLIQSVSRHAIALPSDNIVAITCGNDIDLSHGNVIAVGHGNIVAVTVCHDVRHFEPHRGGMLYALFAGRHIRKIQLPGTNNRDNRRDKRNPE